MTEDATRAAVREALDTTLGKLVELVRRAGKRAILLQPCDGLMESNSDDLLERLRARLEAADEIERLRAQVAEQAVQLEQAEAKLARVREAARRLRDEEGGPA